VEPSSPSDDGEYGKLITLDRFLVQGAVARIDHGYADLFRVNILGANNIPYRNASRKFLFLYLETVFPEKSKQLDRNQYFVVPHI
jgi:hypothetical protein